MAKRPKLDLATRPTVFLHLAQCALIAQLATSALYYNGEFNDVLIHKFLVAQFLALAAWLAYGLHTLQVGEWRLVRTPYDWPLIALAGWAALRSFTAPDASALHHAYIPLVIASVLPLWATLLQHRSFQRLFAASLIFIGLVMMIGCLRQLSTDTPGFTIPGFAAMTLAPGSYERQRLCSFLGHNNSSTAYIAIACIYAAFFAARARASWRVGALLAYIGLGIALIVLGGSRGTALMVIAATLILLYAWQRRWMAWAFGQSREQASAAMKQWAWRGGAAAGVIAVMLAAVYLMPRSGDVNQNVLKRFLTSYDELMTGTYPRVWWMSLLMVSEQPLTGVGFTSWAYEYPYYQGEWFNAHPQTSIGLPKPGSITLRAHNDYFHLWAELGLPGLLILIWLVAVHGRTLLALLRRVNKENESGGANFAVTLGIFAGAATLATMVRATVGFPFHEAAASTLFVANLGMVSAAAGASMRKASPASWTSPLPARIALGAAMAGLYFIASLPPTHYMVGDYLAKLNKRYNSAAIASYNEGDYAQSDQYTQFAYDSLLRSTQIMPSLGGNLYVLGINEIERGKSLNNIELVKRGIERLEESFAGYQYYEVYANKGRAHLWLYEQTEDPAQGQAAIEALRQAAFIQPIDETVHVWLALAMARTGDPGQGLFYVSELELKYPGFTERALLEAAKNFEANDEKLTAAYLFSMAHTNKPQNPQIFEETVRFYLNWNRPDFAEEVFMISAEFHADPANIDLSIQLLGRILERRLGNGGYDEALSFIRALQENASLNDHPMLWYYSTLAAHLAGSPVETMIYAARAGEHGLDLSQLEPLLSATRHGMLDSLIWPM